jgi:hypothetical protein
MLDAASAPASAWDSDTVRAYVDTLIPADDTPSGSMLGVDARLRGVTRGQPDYRRLVELGLGWLNAQARASFGRDFVQLDAAGRETVVGRAASSAFDTLPRLFFERTRATAYFFYYGQPASWRGMRGYRGPPQPQGFVDYAKPPRASR